MEHLRGKEQWRVYVGDEVTYREDLEQHVHYNHAGLFLEKVVEHQRVQDCWNLEEGIT